MLTINRRSTHTILAQSLANEVRRFVDELIIPNEPQLACKENQSAQLQSELAEKARSAGLWGLFYPASYGGKITALEDYLLVAEQEARTEFSSDIFGSHSALDAHMLLKFGNHEIRKQFLEPMISGKTIPSYGMTEPEHSGSIPDLITTSAHLSNGNWHINGRKWFVSNAHKATFITVLARTGEKDALLSSALSMIIVPANTTGLKVERPIPIAGSSLDQSEISFNAVQVPEHYLLGGCGKGLELMNQRLGIGRLLRAMSWVGLAQRCLDLMGARINSAHGRSARLPEKQLVRQHIGNTYQAIASARALIRIAARGVDTQCSSHIEINTAKMAASRALCIASDSAIQLYGAEGISDLTPLSGISKIARASRILDGTEDSLISSIGRQLIHFYQQKSTYSFD
ncbi:acyl-CoA dehydrogenase [Nitrosomonas cryotolerans]|uniref:Acyl-CoA dehydrogenase n=1 Tax=Nitrosomonas cryotolerans ATCC 49181 TaxID=1131553 RepID=A0A1N6IX61_9PROT|nr:acyl-CoA dehydrogenase family protein [Nitrosomonas cryotolerans]SFP85730.1 acyl-CoA dehydrogenase [Nitrosomonas cryotolerans]SIO36545.1 acyl-CoA dehydrogenase [Nitrosomonas cryotolerans ATCC 49181]